MLARGKRFGTSLLALFALSHFAGRLKGKLIVLTLHCVKQGDGPLDVAHFADFLRESF